MLPWKYFNECNSLLSERQKRKFYSLIILQCALSLFDIFGIFLVGLLVYLGSVDLPFKTELSLFGTNFHFSLHLRENRQDFMLWLSILALLFFSIKGFAAPILLKKMFNFLGQLAQEISRVMCEKLFYQDVTWHNSVSSQRITFALGQGVTSAMNGGLGSAVIMISEFLLLILILILLIFANWILALFGIMYFGIIAISLSKTMSKKQSANGKVRAVAVIEANESLQESMRAIREIKLYGVSKFFIDRFNRARANETTAAANLQFFGLVPKYAMEFALVFGIFLIGTFLALNPSGTSTNVSVSLFIAASMRLMPSILRIQSAYSSFHESIGTSKATLLIQRNLLEQFRLQADLQKLPNFSLPRIDFEKEEQIRVIDLSFKYDLDSTFELSNISFRVMKGESIAIVGPTGSGKSTLVDLLMGLLEPSNGGVYLRPKYFDKSDYLNQNLFGYVPQNIPIFNSSIAENIALGIPRDQIDLFRVSESLRKVQLENFIVEGESWFARVVGEGGVNLSGGQKQRIGIARALYRCPEILILDEATSALDAETERAITLVLESLKGEVTVITIAHRLATIRNANKVLYIENGKLMGIGTFNELRLENKNFDTQANLMGL